MRCLEEVVLVDEAADGARDRCEKEDRRGFPGRPPMAPVSLGVGPVARNCGSTCPLFDSRADVQDTSADWG